MEEKHTCNCNNKANSEDLKRLELLALGTYSQRVMNKVIMFIAAIIILSIIAGTIIAVYGINRYHNYIMNTETVEYTEVIEDSSNKQTYDSGGNIINNTNSNIDTSIIGADNGSIQK